MYGADADGHAISGGQGHDVEAGVPKFPRHEAPRMRFRGVLRASDPKKLGLWLDNACRSGIPPIRANAKPRSRRSQERRKWSSGQAEGQIDRLKTLKRTMYSRARIELNRYCRSNSRPNIQLDDDHQLLIIIYTFVS